MHIINTRDLKGSEILAKNVLSNSDIVLVYKGTVLKKEYINRLVQLGIDYVFIEDQIQENNFVNINIAKTDIIDTTNTLVKNILEQHIHRNNSSIIKLCDIAQMFIDEILAEEEIYEEVINIKQENIDLYTHSVNVCTLSTLLALKLKLDKDAILDIAKGSILHDLGLRYVTTSYENIDIEMLSDLAKKEYRKHVIYGYETVSKLNFLSDISKKVILHHHETYDGKGFPFKLKGDRIPYEAEIVAVCDAFDRRRSGIGSVKMSVNEITEFLKVHKLELYNKKIIDMLLSIVAVYPIGTKVVTNNNEKAIVIRQNKDFLERPVIMIIEDENGKTVDPPRETDLLKVLNIYINEVLN